MKKSKEEFELIELNREKERICQQCCNFIHCSEKHKQAPECRIIFELYNKRFKNGQRKKK